MWPTGDMAAEEASGREHGDLAAWAALVASHGKCDDSTRVAAAVASNSELVMARRRGQYADDMVAPSHGVVVLGWELRVDELELRAIWTPSFQPCFG